MGTKEAFVEMKPGGDVKHARGFNGVLQNFEGHGIVALRMDIGEQILVPVVLYVPVVQANLLFAGQLKDSDVKLQDVGGEMLLISAKSMSAPAEVVALRTIASTTKSMPDMWHARLVHIGVDTIKSLATHEVVVGLDIKQSTTTDLPCVPYVGGKLAWHTFPDQGLDVENALEVVHMDLYESFRVAAKDGRKTHYVWVRPIKKKNEALVVFEKWRKLVERQTSKMVKMLHSDRGGKFLGRAFTELVEDKGILHNLTCPYTPQKSGMAERETRTVVEIPSGTTPHELLFEKKPDLTLARMWGYMVQFMVPEKQRGGKLAPKARWGLHLRVSPESKEWEVLNLTNNKVVTILEAILYETISLEAPREWHDTLRTTLAALGFASSTADPSLFLRTDTSLPPFYVLVYINDLVFATADTEALTLVKSELQKRHTCTDLAPPLDESVEPSCPYPELMGCLMYLMTCIRPDLAYPLSLLARYVAPGRHRKVHWDAAKRVLRYLCGTSGMGLMLGGRGPVVLSGHADASWVDESATQQSSSCEAEIYARAMAAQELRWLTYLLTDLGEQPRSPPFLYVDNKAMISLCLEHKLEHRTKHIPLRYFLARELQQRGQLCLAYVATRANTADIFTKALPPGDHQRFSTVLGLVPTLPDLLTV
ncbi:unnamed protein product [Closterium sp. NIES-53]